MTISSEANQLSLTDKVLLVLVTLVPMAAILGNAIADIGLVLMTIGFLATSRNQWGTFTQSRFLRLAALFWLWLLLTSALSLFPKHSFQDSLPYIRFPLYAFALSYLLGRRDSLFLRYFMMATVAGTLIEFTFMMREYLFMRDEAYARLHGTFGKLIPGWYLSSLSLIALLWGIESLKRGGADVKKVMLLIAFGVVTLFGVVISGEIMSTLFVLGTLALYVLMRAGLSKWTFGLLAIGVIGLGLLWLLIGHVDPQLHDRIVDSLNRRLPWMPSSDYYAVWESGVVTWAANPFFGVGTKNHDLYCHMLDQAGLLEQTLHMTTCHWHPHNLWLQIASETGIIGVILFSLLTIYLLSSAWRSWNISNSSGPLNFVIIFVLFFPLQTYSQAFGQSKNFYFWTLLGFALFGIRQYLKKDNSDERL